MFDTELQTALAAVAKASALCSVIQNHITGSDRMDKSDRSPVTVADFGSQAVIIHTLKQALPDDPVVGEEDAAELREREDYRHRVTSLVQERIPGITESDILTAIDLGTAEPDYSKRFWTVDPIDGTKGFLRGDQYAVALALIEDGQVVLGVLGCPNFSVDDNDDKDSLIYAVKGAGTFLKSGSGAIRPLSVIGVTDTAQACFCESVEKAHAAHGFHSDVAHRLGITTPPYRIDSQAKYAAVSAGRATIYLRRPRDETYREKIWDHAAGAIVVEEAGGRVTDFKGQPLDFSKGRTLSDNRGILATNGKVHDEVLKAIEAAEG